jgi:hypothetical protein
MQRWKITDLALPFRSGSSYIKKHMVSALCDEVSPLTPLPVPRSLVSCSKAYCGQSAAHGNFLRSSSR